MRFFRVTCGVEFRLRLDYIRAVACVMVLLRAIEPVPPQGGTRPRPVKHGTGRHSGPCSRFSAIEPTPTTRWLASLKLIYLLADTCALSASKGRRAFSAVCSHSDDPPTPTRAVNIPTAIASKGGDENPSHLPRGRHRCSAPFHPPKG
jgi:hypothetical protein